MAKADFENDGFDDIAWRNWSTGASGYWDFNDTTGAFTWKPISTTWTASFRIVIGDLGGGTAGRSDLILLDPTGSLEFAYSIDGTGGLISLGWSASLAADSRYLAVEGSLDITNDGVEDLLYQAGPNLYLRDFSTPTSYVDILYYVLPLGWSVIFADDFTGDNADDILVVDQYTGYMGYIGGGWHGLGYTTTEAVGDGWRVYGTGDFTNDGSADILWFNQASNQVGFWDLAAGAWSGWVGLGAAGSGWSIVTVGDYTGDNFEDIVWRNTQTGSVGIWDINTTTGSYNWIGLGAPSWDWDLIPA